MRAQRFTVSRGAPRFGTLREAQGKAARAWVCAACLKSHAAKAKACGECGGALVYFASKAEARRYAALRWEEHHGAIAGLEVHPAFPLHAHTPGGPVLVATYYADFRYTRAGVEVVEDVKASSKAEALDPVFKLKRRHAEAEHGIRIVCYSTR